MTREEKIEITKSIMDIVTSEDYPLDTLPKELKTVILNDRKKMRK